MFYTKLSNTWSESQIQPMELDNHGVAGENPMRWPWPHVLHTGWTQHHAPCTQHRGLIQDVYWLQIKLCWNQCGRLGCWDTTCCAHSLPTPYPMCRARIQSNSMCYMQHVPTTELTVHMANGTRTGYVLLKGWTRYCTQHRVPRVWAGCQGT